MTHADYVRTFGLSRSVALAIVATRQAVAA
jgi:hypothetical protein